MPPARPRPITALSQLMQRYVRHHQLRRRDKVCRHGITISQCYALEAVVAAEATGTMTVTDLAEVLQVNKSSASRVAESLVALGLVALSVPPDNARKKLLTATARGSALATRIHRDIEVEHSRSARGFTDRDIHTAHRLLQALMEPSLNPRRHP
jgi:MarR family transcriptional regulator, 2-MHQ and catechol-resistance regulon repressor